MWPYDTCVVFCAIRLRHRYASTYASQARRRQKGTAGRAGRISERAGCSRDLLFGSRAQLDFGSAPDTPSSPSFSLDPYTVAQALPVMR